jgi:hypothetical protein
MKIQINPFINWNNYTKRAKVYDPKIKLWTNTKPLYIDNLTRSIVIYNPKNIIKYKPKGCSFAATTPPIISFPFYSSAAKLLIVIFYSYTFNAEKINRFTLSVLRLEGVLIFIFYLMYPGLLCLYFWFILTLDPATWGLTIKIMLQSLPEIFISWFISVYLIIKENLLPTIHCCSDKDWNTKKW